MPIALFQLYRQAYGGLPRAAWLLAGVMLVNRCGTMVVPFLALYLTKARGFGMEQAGDMLSFFGLGAILGSYLGGQLTDRFGYFKVQFWSLLLGGGLFFVLMLAQTYAQVAVCVLVLSTVGEAFRPANSASVAHYNPPQNLPRAYALNRLASNLGFSVGPALGGFLASHSYDWLFVADGLTSIAAAGLIWWFFRPEGGGNRAHQTAASAPTQAPAPGRSPYTDGYYLAFMGLVLMFATGFFQLFSTLPLYYKEVYRLSEDQIGWLMTLNGVVVVLVEMVVVYRFGQRPGLLRLISWGTLLSGLAYAMLNWLFHWSWLVLGMVVLSLGEIFAMPFMASVAVSRATQANRGRYMALYNMAYSAAHVLAPALGTRIAAAWGFPTLWYGVGAAGLLTWLGFRWLAKR
ncbi:MAG: MFS transporter [Bernardetiaceae bacterium]|jgi:predicted MFS family arabinose efflux permease|nr:MFS transporter [Bernardetiaceae bacterium]